MMGGIEGNPKEARQFCTMKKELGWDAQFYRVYDRLQDTYPSILHP